MFLKSILTIKLYKYITTMILIAVEKLTAAALIV